MGVKLASLITSTMQTIDYINRWQVAIDGTYVIISSLQKIRPDGKVLANRWGEPLASLHGIFFKTLRLMEIGSRPCYVFDGIPPPEKKIPVEKQRANLHRLWLTYTRARVHEEVDRVRSLFQSISLTYRKSLFDAIEILKAMGVPAFIAPSEGEAQGAWLVQNGYADALYSPDYDALLFGCPKIIRSLDFSNKTVEIVELDVVLGSLGITQNQLVDVGILIGTDFNKGVPRIGPKRGLALIQKFERIEDIPKISPPSNLEVLRELFLSPIVSNFQPKTRPPNIEMVHSLLMQKGFNQQRAIRARRRLFSAYQTQSTSQEILFHRI